MALALLLPNAMVNAGLERPWLVLLGLDAGLLLLTIGRFRPRREDLGFLLLAAASLWPHVVSDPFRLSLGGVGYLAVVYAIGRLGGLAPRSMGFLVLAIGALQGAIAIAESIPAVSSLVAFEPIRHGVVSNTTRATGLFNNPNTLGSLEAFALIFAVVAGLGRRSLPLASLCVVGLVLSSSRESVFGLLVGLCFCWFGPIRQAIVQAPASWTVEGLAVARRTIIAVLVIAAFALMAVAISPTSIARFNPISFGNDYNLLARLDGWRAAVGFIQQAPLIGYGSTLPVRVVDNAYLGWELGGGAIGLILWLGGLITFTPRRARPLLAALFAIALFANPFSGPLLAAFLIVCGAYTAEPVPTLATEGSPPEATPLEGIAAAS